MGKIIHVVAIDKNNCIGGDNKLLWKQRADMLHFKALTTNNIVVMGRKTFESMNSKPLPNRINIVISRKYGNTVKVTEDGNLIFCGTISNAIKTSLVHNKKDIFIIGGGEIYSQTLDIVDEVHMTIIDTEVTNGDTYYPNIIGRFGYGTQSHLYDADQDKNQYNYKFCHYKYPIDQTKLK